MLEHDRLQVGVARCPSGIALHVADAREDVLEVVGPLPVEPLDLPLQAEGPDRELQLVHIGALSMVRNGFFARAQCEARLLVYLRAEGAGSVCTIIDLPRERGAVCDWKVRAPCPANDLSDEEGGFAALGQWNLIIVYVLY